MMEFFFNDDERVVLSCYLGNSPEETILNMEEGKAILQEEGETEMISLMDEIMGRLGEISADDFRRLRWFREANWGEEDVAI